MDDIVSVIGRLPRTALIDLCNKAGLDASVVHSRRELCAALLDDEPLPPNPISVIRSRVHDMITRNYQVLEGRMDPTCEACFQAGQRKCLDVRAIGDYLANLELMES